MEVRKLVKSGLASYTVSMPKNWIERNRLSKGDLVYLDEIDNKILVSPRQSRQKDDGQDIIINTEDKNIRQIRREIRSAYLNNFNRIYIKGSNLKPMSKDIKDDIHTLASLEVIEETTDKITARSYLDLSHVSILDIIRRIDNIIRSMFADCITLISDPFQEYDLANMVIDRDNDVNRLTFMIFKVLRSCAVDMNKSKRLGLNNVDILKYWTLTFIIEKIADSVKRTVRVIKQYNDKKVKLNRTEMIKLMTEVTQSYENVMAAFYKKDYALADQVYLARTELIAKCDTFNDRHKNIGIGEFTGKMKSVISNTDDINKTIRM